MLAEIRDIDTYPVSLLLSHAVSTWESLLARTSSSHSETVEWVLRSNNVRTASLHRRHLLSIIVRL